MEEERINPDLEKFLDADTFAQKLEIFYGLKYKVDDFMLTNIAMALDIELTKETVEDKYAEILYCLKTMEKYEGSRLR